MHRRLLSLIIFSLLVACQGATDVQSHLVLTLSTDRTSLGVGDTTHLTLTLTNHSSKSMSVPTAWCGRLFTVTDDRGRPAGPPWFFCDAIFVGPTDLAAGQSLTLHDRWAADSGNGSSPLRVDPGIYTLQGTLSGPEHPITSNTIAVLVQGSR